MSLSTSSASTNVIKEDKSITPENFAFVLAQSNYNISTIFRSKNSNETVADTPTNSADMTADAATANTQLIETQTRNHQYQFKILSPSTNQISDLKDAEINIVAASFIPAAITSPAPRLGNQALLSLFSSIELYIDSTLIERIDYPGMSANADFALRYPHNKTSTKVMESHGFIDQLEDVRPGNPSLVIIEANKFGAGKPAAPLVLPVIGNKVVIPATSIDGTNPVAAKTYNVVDGVFTVPANDIVDGTPAANTDVVISGRMFDYNNSSVMWSFVNGADAAHQRYRGLITQRLRLVDLFPSVSTLPPIFNHAVTINFTRNSHNNIIAAYPSTYGQAFQPLQLSAFIDFKIVNDCYIITDELRKAAMEYYSKPIETIFTKCKQIPVGFVSVPQQNNTMSFNVSVDSAYKNKLVVFAIPRATNFNSAYASACSPLDPAKVYKDSLTYSYDVCLAPMNSYTHGGLKSFTVYTMNGVKLQSFDMSRDGSIKGQIATASKLTALDVKANPSNVLIENYQGVYREYLKAREQFGQLYEEGIDYETFIKEYCIYCVDLSCFTISPGENLRIEMVFDDWDATYSPYYINNAVTANGYSSKQIYTLFYSDKVLRLLPNQNVELADLFQPRTEADEVNSL